MEGLERSVAELTEAVWQQTLGVELTPALVVESLAQERTIEGHVHVSGQWRGTLVIQCSYPAAEAATRQMFSLGDAVPSLADVQDAIGELTNMVGGNVKALISEDGCFLSLPVVVEGRDFSVHVSGARVMTRHAFTTEGASVMVTLLEARQLSGRAQ